MENNYERYEKIDKAFLEGFSRGSKAFAQAIKILIAGIDENTDFDEWLESLEATCQSTLEDKL